MRQPNRWFVLGCLVFFPVQLDNGPAKLTRLRALSSSQYWDSRVKLFVSNALSTAVWHLAFRHRFSIFLTNVSLSSHIFDPPTHFILFCLHWNRGGPGVSHWLQVPHRPFVQESWQSFIWLPSLSPTSTIPVISSSSHCGLSARNERLTALIGKQFHWQAWVILW